MNICPTCLLLTDAHTPCGCATERLADILEDYGISVSGFTPDELERLKRGWAWGDPRWA
jgi:hypothetical protein